MMPVKPAFPWPGGKRLIAPRILSRLPEHTLYCEPFAGGLAVLLAKPPSRVEVVNDLDSNLVTFYRVARFHREELLRELGHVLNSREEFEAFASQPGLTDIQRAARWFTRLSLSFGGKGDTFGYSRTSGGSAAMGSREQRLSRIAALSERLDRVAIEHLDWQDVLTRYDAETSVFYCDPPYTVGLQYAAQKWNEADHLKLRDRLFALKGKWVLSYDDSPLVRSLYQGCRLESIDRPNGIGNTFGRVNRRYREVIISPA